MNMEWKLLTKGEAKAITADWNKLSVSEFDEMRHQWTNSIEKDLDPEYRKLRNSLVQEWRKICKDADENQEHQERSYYYKDLNFGLYLYKTLADLGMSVRTASNNRVWMYLCIKVVPDIVNERFPGRAVENPVAEKKSQNVNEERFWKTSRRIYLKTLWWYIYLALQPGDIAEFGYPETKRILENNSTDTIVQIVERSGREGYRPELYRRILCVYASIDRFKRSENDRNNETGIPFVKNKEDLLRKIMVLNTARTVTVEPELTEGGINGYVKELFGYFGY